MYLQPDPIGLDGGTNLYTYVGNNPVLDIDPSGLVTWTGTQKGGSFVTAGGFRFSLKSECVNKKCAKVEVLAAGPGWSFGPEKLKGTGSSSGITFVDSLHSPNPDVFNGEFLYASAGIAIGKWGFGASSIKLGAAKSVGYGRLAGLDASIGFLIGTSTVIDSHFEDCCK